MNGDEQLQQELAQALLAAGHKVRFGPKGYDLECLLPVVHRYATERLRAAAYELGWPDSRGHWRAADVLRAMADEDQG